MIDYKVSGIYILIVKALWILFMKGCIILELFTNNYLLIINYEYQYVLILIIHIYILLLLFKFVTVSFQFHGSIIRILKCSTM